jgi:hypothetical protein
MRGLPFAFWKKSGIIYDVDTLEFIENWELNTGAEMQLQQRLSINNFYRGLKGEGTPNGSDLWTLATSTNARIFPLIPLTDSTANALAYSLDAVSNGVIKGTYTNFVSSNFTQNGVIGGTTKFFNSGTSPSNYAIDDVGGSFYSRTNIQSNVIDFGARDTSSTNQFGINVRYSPNSLIAVINNNVFTPVSNSNSTGFFSITRNESNLLAYRNSSLILNQTEPTTLRSINNFYFHAINQGGTAFAPSSRQLCFYEVGMPYLNANQQLDFYTIVQRLQSNVIVGGRQIGTAIPPI